MSAFLDTFNTNDLMLLATDIRGQYSKKKQTFYNLSQRYYMQAIASNYYKEDDIADALEECRRLKAQYLDICEILKGRGYYYACGDKWQSKDGLVEPTQLVTA